MAQRRWSWRRSLRLAYCGWTMRAVLAPMVVADAAVALACCSGRALAAALWDPMARRGWSMRAVLAPMLVDDAAVALARCRGRALAATLWVPRLSLAI